MSARARARRRPSASTGALQPDASLRLRRHRPRVLRLQQPRERLPDVRRPRRRQAHASGAARSGSEAQHPRRLLRPRGVQVQPRHLGRPRDVQPVAGARFRARRAVEGAARDGVRTHPLRHRARKIVARSPPDAKVRRDDQDGREVGFTGIARRIERWYRRYRQRGEANSRMEAWLDKVMVEHTCPDCNGARLRATRLLFTVDGRTHPRRRSAEFRRAARVSRHGQAPGRGADAGRQVLKEIRGRLDAAARHRPRLPQLQPPIRARCRAASRSASGCRPRLARA